MKFKPSRILNESSNIMGLSTLDLGVLGYFLVFSFQFLKSFDLELLSFLVTAIIGISLLHLRLTHRPKVIRDWLVFRFRKVIL